MQLLQLQKQAGAVVEELRVFRNRIAAEHTFLRWLFGYNLT